MKSSTLRRLALFAGIGVVCQLGLGGCGAFEIARSITRINPCGTLLNCDAQLYEFARSGYEGVGADPSKGIYFTTLPPFTNGESPLIIPP